MIKNFAPSGATAKLCLLDTVTLSRSALENALVDLDQAVAAHDHLGYETAFQAILAMIPQMSVTPADSFEDYVGPEDQSPEAIGMRKLADRDARRSKSLGPRLFWVDDINTPFDAGKPL